MKITIKKIRNIPKIAGYKEKQIEFNKTTKIPNKLLNKTVAMIDELLDRTWDDYGEESWSELKFPLVPFPFFQKKRLPENIGIDDDWIYFWLGTSLQKNIIERARIIGILKDIEGIKKIIYDPVINIAAGTFDGDKYHLEIDRDKLTSTRKLIVEEQRKLSKRVVSNNINNEEELLLKAPNYKTLTLENEKLLYLDKKAPFERGQGDIMRRLLKNTRAYRGETLFKKGKENSILELKELGHCLNIEALRSAMKAMNKKLKSNRFPAKITNSSTGNYILIIKYPPTKINRSNRTNGRTSRK